ncbi:MerR family transcriptional regulator [Microbacter sp. GSS18]|nr:MerR family transcriptional regulator [Microbacter sp. GSS18]
MLIGEVSKRTGISARMLRHYNAIGLVEPSGRTTGGYREYSDADLRRLFHVESLRSLGLSLADVGRALDDPAFAPAALVDELVASTRERIERDERLLARLAGVRAGEPAAWDDVLELVALLRGLEASSPEERQRAALSDERLRLPAAALAEAVLDESDPNVAGALQWALARAGDGAVPILARGLRSPDPVVRTRAVRALAKLDTRDAEGVLTHALRHPDDDVRAAAALAVGGRGSEAAMPELVRMIVAGIDDVDAAEALGGLARRHGTAHRIVADIHGELSRFGVASEARVRLAQALAELPADAVSHVLDELVGDDDRRVALIATYLRRHRADR